MSAFIIIITIFIKSLATLYAVRVFTDYDSNLNGDQKYSFTHHLFHCWMSLYSRADLDKALEEKCTAPPDWNHVSVLIRGENFISLSPLPSATWPWQRQDVNWVLGFNWILYMLGNHITHTQSYCPYAEGLNWALLREDSWTAEPTASIPV